MNVFVNRNTKHFTHRPDISHNHITVFNQFWHYFNRFFSILPQSRTIFQVNPNITTTARITNSVWPTASSTVPNGYGGSAADGTPPVAGNPLEHVPLRFAAAPYYPATFCINDGQTNSIRNTITTSYADYDGIIRLGDNCYADPANNTTGSSTPTFPCTSSARPRGSGSGCRPVRGGMPTVSVWPRASCPTATASSAPDSRRWH